jgi:pSer/pThr/pTyr-binding forkhead associated (FHA) protein
MDCSGILLKGDGYDLRELGSRNGTLLNGERIDRPTSVGDGGLIFIHKSTKVGESKNLLSQVLRGIVE